MPSGTLTTAAIQLPVDTNHQPEPIPKSPDATPLQRAGAIGAVLITVLFTGSWVAKAVLERKAPTFFEVAFAGCAACTALVDPKAVAALPLKFLERKD